MADPGPLLLTTCGALMLAGAALAWFFKRKLGALLAALLSSDEASPPRISLQPDPNQDDGLDKAFLALVADLEAAGFRSVGAFILPEVHNVQLRGFVGPAVDGAASDVLAAVYTHPLVAAPWVDLVEQERDGDRGRTVSTAEPQGQLRQPEWKVQQHLPGASVQALLEAFAQGRIAAPRRLMLADDFVREFERAWAKEQDWRNARGGPSREEIRSLGTGNESDQVIEETWRRMHRQALEALKVPFWEQVSAAHPDFAPSDVFFVHDLMDLEDLDAFIEDELGLGDLACPQPPARQGVPAVFVALPERWRPTLLMTLTQPVVCDVYKRPTGMEDWIEDRHDAEDRGEEV